MTIKQVDGCRRLFARASRAFSVSILLAATILFIPGLTCYAQFDAGEVVGTIRDAAGAAIPGASVILTNVQRGTVEHRVTDAKGDYTFPSVQIGEYNLTAEGTGFSSTQSERFAVDVTARKRVDLELKVGRTAETVTVSGAAALVELDTSDRGEVVDHEEMVDLPLNGRVTADLAVLAPGVRLSSQLDTGLPGSREASYNVNGNRSTANNFLLDGLDNNSYAPQNQGFSSQVIHPSPDATEQFRVQTDNYSAEFGRAGGAIINNSTRSGTNAFHGVIYDYLRNTALNAYGPFLGTGVKPTLIQNQFGATLSGRILRNRLFFFTDYEGFRYIATTYSTSTLPTALQRQGIFTENYTIPLKNPLTGAAYSNGVIPQSAQSAFAKAVLAALPTNTASGTSNNYTQLSRSTDGSDKADFRIDYAKSDATKLFGRFSKQRFDIFSGPGIPGPAGGNSSGYQYGYNTQIALGATYVASSRMLVEGRLGLTWTTSGKDPATRGLPSLLNQYGIGGLPPFDSSAPSLNVQAVTNWTAFGTQLSNPAAVNPFTLNPKIAFTRLQGRHSLRAGYEYLGLRLDYADEYPLYGYDVYNGQFSKGAAAPAAASSTLLSQVYNLSDFLIGARSEYTLSGTQQFRYNQRFNFAYLQDDWKTSGRLTLNMGLRYELVDQPWVDGNQLANFEPTSKSLIFAHAGSNYDQALVHTNFLNFAPRIGFALAANEKTAIKAGYAISYVQGNRNGAEASLAYNTVADSVIDQTPAQPLCPNANVNPSTCFLTTQQGYPAGFTATQAFTATGGEYRYIPAHSPTGYVQSYQLTVQRELAANTLLDAAYVGSHGVHLRVLTDFNQALPNPGVGSSSCPAPVGTGSPCATLVSRRPIVGFNSIIEPIAAGFLTYNSVQIKLRHAYRHGFSLLNSFTYAQAYDNAGAQYEVYNGDGAVVNYYNINGDRGVSGYNQPLNDTTSLTFDVPYGDGRRGANSPRVLKTILGNWSVSAINQVTSGLPVNLTYTPATSGTSNASVSNASVAYSYRPNITGSVKAVQVGSDAWTKTATAVSGVYTKAGLSAPLYTQPFGNVSRNSLRGPAYESIDLGIHKSLPLGFESTRLEFRAEAFNLLNSVNYQTPNANISSSSFGSITSAYPARRLQVALRLSY